MYLKSNQFSRKSHLFYGLGITVIIIALSLFFKNTLLEFKGTSFYFFNSLIFLIVLGIGYYFYQIFKLKKYTHLDNQNIRNLDKFKNKIEFFYSALQIFVGMISIGTLFMIILDLINLAEKYIDNELPFDFKNPILLQLLLQPFIAIIIAFAALSTFFLLASRLKKAINQADMIDQSINFDNTTPINKPFTNFAVSKEHKAAMSNIPTDNSTNTKPDNQNNFQIPSYDNGFFYKKLFEINDNILNLQNQIIVPLNDNTPESSITALWQDKIEPFLTNISNRIAVIEEALQGTTKVNTQKIEEEIRNNSQTPQNNEDITEITPHIKSDKNIKTSTQPTLNDELSEQDIGTPLNLALNNSTTIKNNDLTEKDDDGSTDEEFIDSNFSETKDKIDAQLNASNEANIEDEDEFIDDILIARKTKENSQNNHDDADKIILEDTIKIPPKEDNHAKNNPISNRSFEELNEFLEFKMQQLQNNVFNKSKKERNL